MKRLLIVGTLLLLPTFANAQLPSCETVRSMASTLSRDKINDLVARATPEQIAYGKKCLEGNAAPAKKIVQKKAPKQAKSKHKPLQAHVVPLPRPKPVELVEKEAPPTVSLAVVAPPRTEVAVPQTRSSPVYEIVFWALVAYGLVSLTYHVLKFGVMPTVQAIKGWANGRQQMIADMNREIQSLKTVVAMQNTTLRALGGPLQSPAGVTGPAQGAPTPAA